MSSPFLTPPLISRSDEHDPFKALACDDTSLSMKKRHHPKHYHGRKNSSDSNHGDDAAARTGRLAHSRSLPCLPNQNFLLHQRDLLTPTASVWRQDLTLGCQRRWTLPSKANSTRELSMISPICKQNVTARRSKARTSPALITLRRATNKLSQGTEYTFFPPPKFSQSRTNFVSALLQTMTGGSQIVQSNGESAMMNERNGRSLPKQSIFTKTLDDVKKDVATPTVTEVSMEPVISEPTNESTPFCRRRCSTKYVTKSSVYEIIWDENDTPTDGSQASPGSKVVQTSNSRRHSVAVAQLENQLYKSVAQSRRTSALAQVEGLAKYRDFDREWRFQSRLDSSLSRLFNEAALWNLPRSKASKKLKDLNTSVAPEAPMPSNFDENSPVHRRSTVEVFPPLRSHEATDMSELSRRSLPRKDVQGDPLRDIQEVPGGAAELCGECTESDRSQTPRASTTRAYLSGSKLFGRTAVDCKREDDLTQPLLSHWDDQNPW